MRMKLTTPLHASLRACCTGRRFVLSLLLLLLSIASAGAKVPLRRTLDSRHPMWLIHIDVWNAADPQKIIDLIPADIKPYVVMNLSLSCQYDTEKNVYKMPQNAILTYKSWASICCLNNLWFTCQPASGGHTHIQDDDLETFEYFFKTYKNFLGWNYAEQFWGFDEPNDRSSSTQASRWELFANLVEMSARYGGMLIESFCGNIWSHPLNPVGQLKRNARLYEACKANPENYLALYKYTTSANWFNNESVTIAPFISGFAANYGVRYDNCGWNGALDAYLNDKGATNVKVTYPGAVGIAPVMEQSAFNGACVWDGPELIWTEDFVERSAQTVGGFQRRRWETFSNFDNIWADMFRKIIDGTLYIPTRAEVVERTKIAIVSDIKAANDPTSLKERAYATPATLYDGLYLQKDPLNPGNGQQANNRLYFKSTGRYQAIPLLIEGYDSLAATIPSKDPMSRVITNSQWTSTSFKKYTFNKAYPEEYTGDLYVGRHANLWVTYFPYSYLNTKRRATASVPLKYNTCERMELDYGAFNSGLIREYADRIDFYLNNFRSDTIRTVTDTIRIVGATTRPTFTFVNRSAASNKAAAPTVADTWDETTRTLTLAVSHLGPLDLSVSCSGPYAEERIADAPQPQPTLEPEQPGAYDGDIIIEAEDMDYKSIRSCCTNAYYSYPDERGHSGNGFADMGTTAGAALQTQLKLPDAMAGDYKFQIRYTSPAATIRYRVGVAGSAQYMQLTKTAEQNDWQTVEDDVTLKGGNNQILLTSVSSSQNALIDYIRLVPVSSTHPTVGITTPAADGTATPHIVGRYNLNGTPLAQPQRGINILRMSDGTTRKVLVR